MKRLVTTALLSLAFVLTFGGSVLATASDRWSVSMSTPANTTSKTFNVQYTTLSTEEGDDITVNLFQNGAFVGTQTTAQAFGDSGVFTVTVPAVGTYSYFIEATNSTGDEPKTTGTVNVVVSEAPQAATTSATSATNTATTAGRGSSAPADIDGDGAIDDVNGDGVIDDPVKREEHAKKLAAAAAAAAAVKAARDDNNNGIPDEEEQSEDNDDDESDSNTNGWLIAGGVAVVAGAGGYFLYSRRPKA